MKFKNKFIVALLPLLTACGSGGGSTDAGIPDRMGKPIDSWKGSYLGQEGHGGDAIVCFNIPIDQALYQTSIENAQNILDSGASAKSPVSSGSASSGASAGSSANSGAVWRMTPAGRGAIRSAQPLEEYLAVRMSGGKAEVDRLNAIHLEDGYRNLLKPFLGLPAPFRRVAEKHRALGWPTHDGIASEFGLRFINDSGFINESEIDATHCKELQAVIRRDSQLWYDPDIVGRFDNAGLVLMQLHEELYAWGKNLDEINMTIPGPFAHQTSEKTRRLILKLLNETMDPALLNEDLKALGFSTGYWENAFRIPVAAGYYMDSKTCQSEQNFLRDFFKDSFDWLKVNRLFTDRYIVGENGVQNQLRLNYPDALANMISLMTLPESLTFRQDILNLEKTFEDPASCSGQF